jgi:hypothetical protein
MSNLREYSEAKQDTDGANLEESSHASCRHPSDAIVQDEGKKRSGYGKTTWSSLLPSGPDGRRLGRRTGGSKDDSNVEDFGGWKEDGG